MKVKTFRKRLGRNDKEMLIGIAKLSSYNNFVAPQNIIGKPRRNTRLSKTK